MTLDKLLFIISCCLILISPACQVQSKKAAQIKHPNVLFISIDDLNDWIEPLGGHPQAHTPNLSTFAKKAVNFTRNYCTHPGCNPSRSTLMTGYHTYTSGMYSNYQDWREVPAMAKAKTLGEYFRDNGYYSAGAGKIFHYHQVAPRTWDNYYPSQEKNMPSEYIPEGAPINMPAFKYMYKMFDWYPYEFEDEETADFESVDYILKQFEKDHEKPFFLACGIYKPHVPWYVPKKYFDLFPLEDIQLPEMLENDLDDLGPRAQEIITRGGNYHKHVLEAGKWKEAVQGYLASVAYADAMVGRLLDGLKNSPYSENTIIVLWSDHGWQLGEKNHWRKFALWENLIRTVLMIDVPEGIAAMPDGSQDGLQVPYPTSLIDLYPTLVDLCQLPPRDDLDGISLKPVLSGTATQSERPVISTYDFGDYSVRYKDWHYIHYVDESEELYNLKEDPNEWYNLAVDSSYSEQKSRMKEMLPKNPIPLPEASLIQLQEHHIPPIKSKEYYFSEERKEWLKRFEN